MDSFLGQGLLPPASLLCWRAHPCVCPLFPLQLTHCITSLWGEGMGPEPGGGRASGFCCPALPQVANPDAPSFPHLPPLFLLQMEPHPEEMPLASASGPDLLTVRKSGVSRTHSLPNDSLMCRDGSTADGSLGSRSWGLPKAQSGSRAQVAGLRQAGSAHTGRPHPCFSPVLTWGGGALRQQERHLRPPRDPQPAESGFQSRMSGLWGR